jgi:hypothetical protein
MVAKMMNVQNYRTAPMADTNEFSSNQKRTSVSLFVVLAVSLGQLVASVFEKSRKTNDVARKPQPLWVRHTY